MTDTPSPNATLGPIWRGLTALLAAGLVLNGLFMLVGPGGWYAAVPGVSSTGPLNDHFVRDIGAAFFATGLGAAWAAWRTQRGGLLPAAVFLGLHAAIHLVETLVVGHAHGSALAIELLGIHLPAVLAIALVLPPPSMALLIKLAPEALVGQRIAAAERHLGVPLDYMREIGRAAPALLAKFGVISGLGRQDVTAPAEALHFASLGAVQVDDCGECVQIHVNLALKDGIPPAHLQAALDNRLADLPPLAALALRFGRAAAENDPALETLAEQLQRHLGRRAMFDLAIALGLARFYPVLKRALGYAKSCSLIRLKVA
jgi:AhpD family alkylhydroperoxidase